VLFRSVALKAQSDTCRLDLSQIKPTVSISSANLLEYEWDSTTRMEVGMIDSSRFFVITQDGCKRHRTRLQLHFINEYATDSVSYWIEEVETLIQKLYKDAPDYKRIWQPFLQDFAQQFPVHGTNKPFDISMGSIDFICVVVYAPKREPLLQIDRVEFLFKEKIRSSSQ